MEIEGITYVVDSNTALMNWLTGVSGNDYTHVYIAPGRWSIDYSSIDSKKHLDDVSIGTKTIDGAPGSVICDDNNDYFDTADHEFGGILGYTTQPTKDCYIKNVSFEFSKALTYTPSDGEFSILYNCINIINCNVSAVQTHSTGSAPLACAWKCINIFNCTFSTGYSSAVVSGQNHIDSIAYCKNIANCIFNIINDAQNYADEDSSFYFVDSCANISDCVVYGNLINNTEWSALGEGTNIFSGCTNINNIMIYNESITGYGACDACVDISNVVAKEFTRCKGMSHCCGFSIDQWGYMYMAAASFSNCYADHGTTNAVANTAAGGYNWVTT